MVGNNDINDNSPVEVYRKFCNETFKAKSPSKN